MPGPAIDWLFAGGIIFTAGAALYAAKCLRFETKYFGSHELFHILVLVGTACHYILMLRYVLP